MDRRSPGGLDFLATPPPGVAQPVVAQGRVVHFDWPGTLDDPVTSTTPPQFSGVSLLGESGAFAFVSHRPPARRGKRVRPLSEEPPPPPRPAEPRKCRSVTPDAPRRSGPWGDEACSRPASASSAGSIGSAHEGLLKTLWPDA